MLDGDNADVDSDEVTLSPMADPAARGYTAMRREME